jgi:transcriptional regulator with XRE-family HTH domain
MADLAAKAGVTPDYIGYIERGQRNPAFKLALTLSELLGFPVQKLMENALPREERIIAKKKA